MKSTHPDIWWPSQTADEAQEPFYISYLKNSRWMNRVRTWNWEAFIQLTSDGSILYDFTDVEVGWNYRNNEFYNPSIPGVPASEQRLIEGWQMNWVVTSGGAGADATFAMYFETSQPGFGVRYTNPEDSVFPRLVMGFGAAQSTGPALVPWFSGIDCLVDEEIVNFTSSFANEYTGTVRLDPLTWWEYANADGSDPRYDPNTGDPV